MPRRDPRRNLSRIETTTAAGRPHLGWIVRLQRQGRYSSQFFGDARFGGKRMALQAAKQYRDRVEAESRPWTTAERAQVRRARNQSGIVGVQRVRRAAQRQGKEVRYGYWIAQWTDGKGNRKTRSFSVRLWGEEEARQQAIAARKDGLRRASR